MGQGAPTTPLPRSITSRLAPELYDHVLDEFHSSKTTLSTCSLVCQAWLPICRHHLFSSVNLRPDFVKFLRDSPHAQRTIAPHMRNVGLGGGWMREQQDEFNDIILFMTALDHVRKIHMETWSWSYLAAPATTNLLGGRGNIFQTLSVLDLKFIHFPSFSVFRTLASQFTKLQALKLDNVTWDRKEDSPTPDLTQSSHPPPFLSRFEKLSICACSNAPIISWLLNAHAEDGMVAPIHSLDLPEILPHEATLVGKLLSSLPSSLENLELGFLAHNDDAPSIRDAVGGIDLSLHTKLRTIRVRQLTLYQFPTSPPTPHSSPPPPEISPYVWLVPFLSRIGSSELSEISFDIWLGSERQLDLIDWNALVSVIDNPLFAKLHLVQFHVRGIEQAMDDEVRGWISHRLRDWEGAQEYLRVSFE
ncbi:hypothetical protein C8R47DRAFT_980974 [Mycena vitilis]|nr:hypothetical protein C8R47DRAFT_980974 [Mycena vitilis]